MSLPLLLAQYGVRFTRVKNTEELQMFCPLCRKAHLKHWDDPKLFYNPVKHAGHCKRCGWSCSKDTHYAALLALLDIPRASDPLGGDLSPRPSRMAVTSPLPAEAIPAYQSKRAMAYLETRELDRRGIEHFGILYCPTGYYQERVIVPVCDGAGTYQTFVARSITTTTPTKYLYPKGSTISAYLYNLHFLTHRKHIWLVEGVFDAIHTYPYSVATFGKSLSERQVQRLQLAGFHDVYLLWDHEAWQTTPKLWDKAVYKLKQHFIVYEVKLPHDTPTEYSLSQLKKFCTTQKNALN